MPSSPTHAPACAPAQEWRPDLVLYDAGVDVHAQDGLGRLSLTDQGLARREALVLDTCLSAGIPVAGTFNFGKVELTTDLQN